MKLSEICEILKAELYFPKGNHGEIEISQILPIDQAKTGSITFVANSNYLKYISSSKASAIILADKSDECEIPQLIHKNPYVAFAKLAQLFFKSTRKAVGISEHAMIAADVELGKDVNIYPFVYISDGCKIGDGVELMPGVCLMENVEIGAATIIYPNATIYHETKIGKNCIIHGGAVIGGDGFGFAPGEAGIEKIPQVGVVVIRDNVEVGSTSTIDRAAMGQTLIKSGCKLDSRVQIGHNVELGENCMFSAYSGVAGSSKVGSGVIVGGHSGINGHIEVCDGARFGGMTGVVETVEKPGDYVGFPARPARQWHRDMAYIQRLKDWEKRIRDLEEKLADK